MITKFDFIQELEHFFVATARQDDDDEVVGEDEDLTPDSNNLQTDQIATEEPARGVKNPG